MRNDKKIDVSYSASAEDIIRRFMKAAEEAMPNASLVPVIDWALSRKFTDKVTGKVTDFGPGIGVCAIDQKDLADELIVPMGGLKVAIRLPEELQSADRRRRRQLMSNLCAVLPWRRSIWLPAAFRTCLTANSGGAHTTQ